jgi:hypothetical protein
LADVFDVIVNSADYGEVDKRKLWPVAFERLGLEIGYTNSLLIEDGEVEPAWFRAAGGMAYQYVGEDGLRGWLHVNKL